MEKRIEVIQGDITKIEADAIVNAANTSLLGGGGVDGAIHRAAGPELVQESRMKAPCPTGEARLTKGYKLPASHVIHTVGPVWNNGKYNEPQKLRNCYENSLKIAAEHNFETVAFPSISTGIYRYPVEEAAAIAIDAMKKHLGTNKYPLMVLMVCFDEKTYTVYKKALHDYRD